MEQAFSAVVWAIAIAIGGPIALAAIAGIFAFLYVIIADIFSNINHKRYKKMKQKLKKK